MRYFIFILFIIMSCETYAQQTFEINGVVYKEDLSQKEKMCVYVERKPADDPFSSPNSDIYSFYSGDIIIPAQIEHDLDLFEVTKISPNAFHMCENMTTLTINANIKRLYPQTLLLFPNLTKLILPNSLEIIDDSSIRGPYSEKNKTPLTVIFGKGIKHFGTGNFDLVNKDCIFIFTQDAPLFECPDFLDQDRSRKKPKFTVIIPKGTIQQYEDAWGTLNYQEAEK